MSQSAVVKKKILIVDDEEDLVAMLALRLQAAGCFEIQTAHDGLTGLERALSWLPDVALLDNVMPGLDGWEVCRRLRADPRCNAMAIVVMTAGSPEASHQKARELCADALILKPYEPNEVVATLQTVRRQSPQEA